jgi:hypothetical protein
MAKKSGIPTLIKFLIGLLRAIIKFYDTLIALDPDNEDYQGALASLQASAATVLQILQENRDLGD